ncbi:uncharacterized protein LOC129757752 isoform X2 [Uranotaenia lowii]|uniref:uncharacterized protein LOC129757752 isoform X2 n=1 Tax=Uranotaenia lowii TaxID=190385 RepID=UPI00247B19C4|nr:uncharacterized protein LOC129757752 isoform X2 [Uranotaenia lowii]
MSPTTRRQQRRNAAARKVEFAVMELIQIKLIQHHLFYWIMIFLLLTSSPRMLQADPEAPIFRVDPLALLAGTLRTYQRAGCERELVTLGCPRGTSISIEVAQYGQSGDANEQNLCPASTEDSLEINLPGTEIEIKAPESCTWPNALQYSLLQTVVEACQKKRHCKFLASPKTFGGDPCPGHRKFVEVAYKCRPYEFRSKIACENDVIQLSCNPYSRIAVYSASYGRTEYESLQCAQPQGVKEETCLASYATETVMQKCHGRRKCTLSADSTTFGKPCHPDSRMYLKVVYTCVPRKVLKDRFEAAPEPDEPLQSDLELDQNDLYDEDQFFRESDAIPPGPAPKLQGSPANNRVSDIPIYVAASSTPPAPPRSIQDVLEDNEFSFEEPLYRPNSNGTIRNGIDAIAKDPKRSLGQGKVYNHPPTATDDDAASSTTPTPKPRGASDDENLRNCSKFAANRNCHNVPESDSWWSAGSMAIKIVAMWIELWDVGRSKFICSCSLLQENQNSCYVVIRLGDFFLLLVSNISK